MKQLTVGRDNTSIPLYAIEIPDSAYQEYLAADTLGNTVVPVDARWALVGQTHNLWVGSATFTLPSLGNSGTESIRLNPEMIDLSDVTTLYFMSRAECDINIEYYR